MIRTSQRRFRSHGLAFRLAGLLVGLITISCQPSEQSSHAPGSYLAPRIVVLGFDGLEPTLVEELISEGKLPNFEKLRREGASGPLTSAHPLMSPVIWTTLATGRRPADHGVTDFVVRSPITGKELPVTRRERRVRALWNLFSDAGKSVGVVGWWATWPAEKVLGSMVSDRVAYHFLLADDEALGELPGITYPPELKERIEPLIRQPESISSAELGRFAKIPDFDPKAKFGFGDEVSHLRWALAAAETHSAIGLDLAVRETPDLLLVYVEATDTLAHLFGHLHRQENLVGDLAAQAESFGGTVEAVYELADEILGRYLAILDDDAVLMVLSDHGFELGTLLQDPSKARDLRRVSHRFHKIDGSLFLYGAGVRAGVTLEDASIFDIAPTLLELAGLPASEDMSGEFLEPAFSPRPPPRPRVATYETEPLGTGDGDAGVGNEAVDAAVLEKLRSLGYIGGGEREEPSLSRNDAAFAMKEGKYREAARAYFKLIQASPENPVLHVDLAAALLALHREEEALESVDRALELSPAFAPAFFRRGQILESQGHLNGAVKDYRTAVRFDEGYQAPRKALDRLGERWVEKVAKTPEEVESALLLQKVRDAARRGDYNAAWQVLGEAERLTPEAAVVFQFKANIAYLQGDLEAAEAALVRALELEPDNPQFQENLRRIREKG